MAYLGERGGMTEMAHIALLLGTAITCLPPHSSPPRCGIDSILLPTTKKFAINVMENSWVHKFKDWGDKVRGERRRASGGKWVSGKGQSGVLVGATTDTPVALCQGQSALFLPPPPAHLAPLLPRPSSDPQVLGQRSPPARLPVLRRGRQDRKQVAG